MIIAYIQANWIKWLFALLLAILGWGHRQVMNQLTVEKAKSNAIAEGVQALLRDSIVTNYNKYSSKGYCPIYVKESMRRAYQAYAALGGNDVAQSLYHKLLAMPEEIEQNDKRDDTN